MNQNLQKNILTQRTFIQFPNFTNSMPAKHKKNNIHHLLNKFAAKEDALLHTTFLAPCLPNSNVQTRVNGIIYSFEAQPNNFEGWGIFKVVNPKKAHLVEQADFIQVSEYLQLFKTVKLHLLFKLRGKTWLAYPINEGDAKQRLGKIAPVPVHLTQNAQALGQIISRWDGANFWFEEEDRKADPFIAEDLREAFTKLLAPKTLSQNRKGLTPEILTAYTIVYQQSKEYRAKRQAETDEKRLNSALKMGGGQLQNFRDKGKYWLVEWTTSNGETHNTAIEKKDLTVMSAGICLSGLDRDFDLQSLVGVVEKRD